MSTICDDLRKSILKAAMNGDLSASREGWNESKLEELCVEITTGGAAPQGKNNFCDDGPCFVRVADMGKLGVNKKLNDTRDHLTNSGVGKLKLFPTGTVLFTKSGASLLLNQRAILEKPMYVVSHIGCAIPNDAITSDFLYLILKSIDFNEYAHATSLPSLKITDLKNIKVSYPNIEQQKQIVEKVDELMARVADLEQSADALTSLKKVFPDEIKASLLQAAMQGKLTKQLPEDGSAEDLLEEIKAEKEKLIAECKIKRQKPLAPITDGEIPFNIPENWQWVRFGDANELISGTDLTPDKYSSKPDGILYITGASNIQNGHIVQNRWTKNASRISKKGDLLLTCKGTVGTTAILDVDEAHIARQIMAIRPICLDVNYIKFFIDHMVPALKSAAKSMIPGIERGNVLNMLLPLPPLAEQKRIVERLDALMQNINVVGDLIASE